CGGEFQETVFIQIAKIRSMAAGQNPGFKRMRSEKRADRDKTFVTADQSGMMVFSTKFFRNDVAKKTSLFHAKMLTREIQFAPDSFRNRWRGDQRRVRVGDSAIRTRPVILENE